jgi:putative transposase
MRDKFKSQPPRLYENNSTYFLTFNTYKRKSILCRKSVPRFLLDEIKFQCKNLSLNMNAYVIMPEHIHLLVKCIEAKAISKFLKQFKSFSSRGIKRILNINDKIIWQRGTYDHVIDGSDDYENHLNYIHLNPVKHGYVERPEDWKWSSFQKYLKKGYYEVGWGHQKFDFESKKKYSWNE